MSLEQRNLTDWSTGWSRAKQNEKSRVNARPRATAAESLSIEGLGAKRSEDGPRASQNSVHFLTGEKNTRCSCKPCYDLRLQIVNEAFNTAPNESVFPLVEHLSPHIHYHHYLVKYHYVKLLQDDKNKRTYLCLLQTLFLDKTR